MIEKETIIDKWVDQNWLKEINKINQIKMIEIITKNDIGTEAIEKIFPNLTLKDQAKIMVFADLKVYLSK